MNALGVPQGGMGADPGSVALRSGAPHQAAIVGCGFAGLFAAQALRRAPVEVTVTDRTNHHLFQPLLYQMVTAILSQGRHRPADSRHPVPPAQRQGNVRRDRGHRPAGPAAHGQYGWPAGSDRPRTQEQ